MILRLEFHSTWGVSNSGRHDIHLLSVSLQGSLGHLQECFLDRSAIKCASLVEEHVVVLAGPLLALRGGHLSL